MTARSRFGRWAARSLVVALGVIAPESHTQPAAAVVDPLPSWNETASKAAIATFENDGTPWAEQPVDSPSARRYEMILATDVS